MKNFIKTTMLIAILCAGGFLGFAQDRTEICRGSGYHCMDVDYGGIKAKFVKGKNQPGAVIVEEEKKVQKL